MSAIGPILSAIRKRLKFSEGQVPHDAQDMIYERGKAPEALLYSLLFVPELSIVAGSVLLTNGDPSVEERFVTAKESRAIPLDQLEASFNMIDVPYIFNNRDFDEEEERLLAERIAEAWRRALAAFCPERRFIVNVVTPEHNAGDTRVEFFEYRSVPH